jgi:hypothetical protein
MARTRKRIELEEGLKLDLNKLRVQAVSQGGSTQQVIYCNPRYSGDTRRFGLLVWRFSSPARGSMRLLFRSLDQLINLVAAPRHFAPGEGFGPPTGRGRADPRFLGGTRTTTVHLEKPGAVGVQALLSDAADSVQFGVVHHALVAL